VPSGPAAKGRGTNSGSARFAQERGLYEHRDRQTVAPDPRQDQIQGGRRSTRDLLVADSEIAANDAALLIAT
jgi:hypothetical protein